MDEQQTEQEELQAKCAEYLNGWKRSLADYENLNNDISRQIQEASAFGQARAVMQILPLYDYYKMAIGHIPEDQQKVDWVQGIMHIHKGFQDFLKNLEIEEILSQGQEFNPEVHEAIAEEESELPEGTIVKEIQTGYTMKGKVLVSAKVIIAKSQNN